MNRRGFIGRLGALAGAAVTTVAGTKTAEAAAIPPAPVETASDTIHFRPTLPPHDHVPTFREAYEAARRGELWVDGRTAPVDVPKREVLLAPAVQQPLVQREDSIIRRLNRRWMFRGGYTEKDREWLRAMKARRG